MTAIDGAELDALVDYWRCANYLTVAQIYLQANPLLREPLRAEHIKPRLLGHWGTSPGLSLVYVQLNRLIRQTGADVIYVAGPGHGGPALVANTYLEGSYSELFPEVTADEPGLVRLVRQFSTPGGIPSHASVTTPGSIHEGGELGYALVHAFGAAFDHPDLLVACVVGDGEAETGPLAGSWKGIRFLHPARDGAVLPILHLNGYKIASATVLGRRSDEEVAGLLRAEGYEPQIVAGDDPHEVHRRFAEVLEGCYARIREIQADARADGAPVLEHPPAWPAIVLRTPKGWTGPDVVDGVQIQGTFRAHQVPLSRVREVPEHLALLETWLRSYAPERHFDERGRLVPELAALAPEGDKRMGSSPYANGGRLLRPLDLPSIDDYAIGVVAPGAEPAESTRRLGAMLRDIYRRNPTSFRLYCPDETASNRLQDVFDVSNRCLVAPILATDDHLSADGRVMEVLSEHLCEGWLEGYLLSGRHGLFATYEAFAMVSASMTVQHAKWLQEAHRLDWREPVASLNVLLTSTCWRNDHNGFSHQGPGLIDAMISLSGSIVRVYLPPDANCLLSVAEHSFHSRDYVNLIVSDKQPQLQYLDMAAAREHCARGAAEWEWAGTVGDGEPDVVMACAGDIVTMEALAAAELLRLFTPDLEVRFVNVVDLMSLAPPGIHPHGLPEDAFERLFGQGTEVIFAFHGYARALHQMLHGRRHPGRFHVHGFTEQGTTTTPFDMVVLNHVSRYHLASHALTYARRRPKGGPELAEHCQHMLEQHHAYVRTHFEDMPEIRDWRWGRVVTAQRVLCINAGSSSLRVTVAEREGNGRLRTVAGATVERIGGDALIADEAGERVVDAPDHAAALDRALELEPIAGTPAAIGHRLVHGGPKHDGPHLLDRATLVELDRWRPLAPLHLPIALGLVATTGERFPGVPQVGCFDTAFGRALPNTARRLPIPSRLDAAGLQRYGFHGLSYQSVLDRLGAESLGRAVIAHLGAGASLAAVVDGRPVHTTMGVTPSGGTVMATRPGDLDPGLFVYLVEQGMDAAWLRALVDYESGLAGISGRTGDMRELLVEREHDAAAALAIEVFCRSAAMHAAACTAVLGGLDSLVFTGGIGEHSPVVRTEICQRLAHLGVHLDAGRNERGAGVISASGSAVAVHAIASDEESVIARETAAVALG